MITAVFDRNSLNLAISGHAYSGVSGHDLVCAASSMLAFTLAANIGRLGIPSDIQLESGDAHISCAPNEGTKQIATYLFESICVGFEMLAVDYPDFIKYEIVQG